MQRKSPPVQPYGNLDMGVCRLSSCNLECTKYIPVDNACGGIRQYIAIDIDSITKGLNCLYYIKQFYQEDSTLTSGVGYEVSDVSVISS